MSVDVFDSCIVRDLLGDAPIELAIRRRVAAADADVLSEHRDRKSGQVAAQFEIMLCRPVPGVADALARIRAVGVAITFLSDTDRQAETLRGILEQAGIYAEGDRLIASCEAGATKSDGDLYERVWPPGSFTDGEVWHVGNDLWSDVTMADQAGLVGFAITEAEPTRYETVMAGERPGSAGPAVAAAARKARLAIAARADGIETAAESRLEVLGAQVGGQAFGAFLLWVAGRSWDQNIGHLSFLSRDAELLLAMAQSMPDDHWTDTTLGYLHCSRWSWLLTGAASYGLTEWLGVGTADDRAFIHADRHHVSLSSLLGRIGLEPGDLGDHRDLAALAPDRPLPTVMADQWHELLADERTQALILSRSMARRDMIVAYLRGLGLPSCRVGLVDVGWRGRLAWAMSPIIEDVTDHKPIHLHFGGHEVLPDVDEAVNIERFAFDGYQQQSLITNPVSCVETITASGRPRVVGYDWGQDQIVGPVLARGTPEIHNNDRRLLWSGAIEAASNLPSRRTLDELGCSAESLGPEARSVLATWWARPATVEAETLRGLAFEADDDGHTIRPVANPYSLSEIAPWARRTRQWQQGSAALSPLPLRVAINVYRFVRAQLDTLRS
ncbi:MAG: HAD family hydrolase [Actinomycetia bacterium]|nr:HAD family hydrolase [Actinomycetes bacterium]